MNENEIERPLDETAPANDGDAKTLAAVDQTVEAASQATADAAAEAEISIEALTGAAQGRGPDVTEATVADEPIPAEPIKALPSPKADAGPSGGNKQTIGDRLAEDVEFDPDANNDDRIMAALSYGSQLIFPLSLLMPIIILVSETSKQRAFQRYHAVQSLALGIITWTLGAVYLVAWTTLGWLAFLCLCLMFPAMIAIWLLPLYYAIPAYNGKRFKIPGLTQFLRDQRWL